MSKASVARPPAATEALTLDEAVIVHEQAWPIPSNRSWERRVAAFTFFPSQQRKRELPRGPIVVECRGCNIVVFSRVDVFFNRPARPAVI